MERLSITSLAVIGGGPSEVAVAKFLKSEHYSAKIAIFEQRRNVGGIWNTDVSQPLDADAFPSSIYEGMESNIPSCIMQHSDLPFPDGCPLLSDAKRVLEYLERYAADVLGLVQFRQQVVAVFPACCGEHGGQYGWELEIRDLETGSLRTEHFDAVVVATGRYDEPYTPNIIGMAEWNDHLSGTIIHSKQFRSREPFKNKKVVIVGFSFSGIDIATHIEPVCASPLLISQKSADKLFPGSAVLAPGRIMLPGIVELNWEKRRVKFADGREELNVDCIIMCTGYNYSYPFLSRLPSFNMEHGLGNNDTYQHIFYTPRPTLAFALLPLRVVAFPFVESQAAIIARVWSGRLALPSRADMQIWVDEKKQRSGTGKSYHMFSFPKDADYMNEMYEWCRTAKNPSSGRLPPFWGPRKRWLLKRIHSIRQATEEKGEDRFLVTKIEDVGYHCDLEES